MKKIKFFFCITSLTTTWSLYKHSSPFELSSRFTNCPFPLSQNAPILSNGIHEPYNLHFFKVQMIFQFLSWKKKPSTFALMKWMHFAFARMKEHQICLCSLAFVLS